MPRAAEAEATRLLEVVAAAILWQDRVLLAQRLAGQHLAGTWEFPGGKVEAGESQVQALQRELSEEIAPGRWLVEQAIATVHHTYPERDVDITLYRVPLPSWFSVEIEAAGSLQGRLGQPLQWQPVHSVDPGGMPAANAALLAALRRDML